MINCSVPTILIVSCIYAIMFKTFYTNISWDDTVTIALIAACVGYVVKKLFKL